MTVYAFIKEQAGVGGHYFFLLKAALGAGYH